MRPRGADEKMIFRIHPMVKKRDRVDDGGRHPSHKGKGRVESLLNTEKATSVWGGDQDPLFSLGAFLCDFNFFLPEACAPLTTKFEE